MDYKGLLDANNATVITFTEAMHNMIFDIPLVWTQMTNNFQGYVEAMLSQVR